MINIKNELKYQKFFEHLDRLKLPYKIDKDCVIIDIESNKNQNDITYIFRGSKDNPEVIHFPNINFINKYPSFIFNGCFEKITFNQLNLNELLFEDFYCQELCFNEPTKTKISGLKFDNINNINYEQNVQHGNIITIPENLNIEKISIKNPNIIIEIKNNKYINYINIHNKKNMIILGKFENLRHFSFTNFNKNINPNISIESYPNIETIFTYGILTTKKIFFKNLPKLNCIQLSANYAPVQIENCPNIKEIDINCKRKDIEVDICDNILNLKELVLNNCTLKNSNVFKNSNFNFTGVNLICSDILHYEDNESIIINIIKENKNMNYYYRRDLINMLTDEHEYIKNNNKKINNKLFSLRKSNTLMKKLFQEELNTIKPKDWKLINNKDLCGVKAISYCRTKKSLEYFLCSGYYIKDYNDINFIYSNELKSIFEKHIIKNDIYSKNKTLKNIKDKNAILNLRKNIMLYKK